MKQQIQAVSEFHNKFKVQQSESPCLIPEKEYILRHRLMSEETEEYMIACENENLVEIADALGDQLYILLGTILKHGLQHKIEDVFDEIQRSNMSKLDIQGNPILRADGKIEKGPNYTKPDINKILL
jgi:predicted HAD superfamily Cof-like phosphohydrolase